MNQHIDLGAQALAALRCSHALTQKDLGSVAHLSKGGMAFDTEAWAVEGFGHLCVMRMKAFFGLMRMETAVFVPTSVDLPLFNLDWVRAAGTETQFAELYDTQLEAWPQTSQAAFHSILDRNGDLTNSESSGHWYDAILYSCSCHKKGRKLSARFSRLAQDYIDTYISQLDEAPACDTAAKEEKVRAFAERLYAEGGPAVDQVTKLFGTETAHRLVVGCMYGVEGA